MQELADSNWVACKCSWRRCLSLPLSGSPLSFYLSHCLIQFSSHFSRFGLVNVSRLCNATPLAPTLMAMMQLQLCYLHGLASLFVHGLLCRVIVVFQWTRVCGVGMRVIQASTDSFILFFFFGVLHWLLIHTHEKVNAYWSVCVCLCVDSIVGTYSQAFPLQLYLY